VVEVEHPTLVVEVEQPTPTVEVEKPTPVVEVYPFMDCTTKVEVAMAVGGPCPRAPIIEPLPP
jgi:hypothetical protein